MAKEHHKIEAEVWKCEDLLKTIRGTIDAHVKDAGVADRLEQGLRAFYAYRATSKVVIFDEPASGK
jgi:hypothetical protein